MPTIVAYSPAFGNMVPINHRLQYLVGIIVPIDMAKIPLDRGAKISSISRQTFFPLGAPETESGYKRCQILSAHTRVN